MQQECPKNTHNEQLIIDSKSVTWIISAFLLLLFFVFMLGYFFGKHQAFEQFSHTLEQESISDRIYSSLYASYEKTHTNSVKNSESEEPNKVDTTVQMQETPSIDSSQEKITTYYAPLIGFGSKKTAQNYANRLMRKGFPVLLKSRTSKTTKGREVVWYQIVTKSFEDRVALESLIALLQKQEHLASPAIMVQ